MLLNGICPILSSNEFCWHVVKTAYYYNRFFNATELFNSNGIDCDMDGEVVINDAIYGSIKLHPLCIAVIDTLEFQRLRALKQCGVCHLVYPSATHSRFEHSIGVCHWAEEFVKHCGASVPDDKTLCVLIAGLCHDLGHGPFSHLWERFLHCVDVEWKHETSSVEMFKSMIRKNKLAPVFEKYGLFEEHLDFICRLIQGAPQPDETDLFLYEIIANSKNGLDVDKFEYIMRDTRQFGMKFDLDVYRILNHIGVVEKDGKRFIGFRDKISESLLDVFLYRAKLHRICYQHHACKATELMLTDALLAANEYLRISWVETQISDDGKEIRELKTCKLSECHQHSEAFMKATDGLFYDILYSTAPQMDKSRKLLESMLLRDLYPLVYRKPISKDSQCLIANMKDITDELTRYFAADYNCEFRYCLAKFSIGPKGDPLSNVLFFDKRNPTVPFNLSSNDIKLTSFIGDRNNLTEFFIFCTMGKKSLDPQVHEAIRTKTEEIILAYLEANKCH